MPSAHVLMRWSDLLFVHWPMEPEAVEPHLPDGLELDTFGGRAWVGLVPFSMPVIRPPWWPGWLRVPRMTSFLECNVRTYAVWRGVPGVWFLSLDAGSPLAVRGARLVWRLPYFDARIRLGRSGSTIDYTVRRRARGRRWGPAAREASMRARWTVGDPLPRSGPESLEHFLTERYALFAAGSDGRVRVGRIEHDPWPLREARLEYLVDELVVADGLPAPAGTPHVMAADPIEVRGWRLADE